MNTERFGATVTLSRQQLAAHPHIVFIRHEFTQRSRKEACLLTAGISAQVLMVESAYHFIIAVLGDNEAEKIRQLPAVRGVGAVNIDIERLLSIMKNGA